MDADDELNRVHHLTADNLIDVAANIFNRARKGEGRITTVLSNTERLVVDAVLVRDDRTPNSWRAVGGGESRGLRQFREEITRYLKGMLIADSIAQIDEVKFQGEVFDNTDEDVDTNLSIEQALRRRRGSAFGGF